MEKELNCWPQYRGIRGNLSTEDGEGVTILASLQREKRELEYCFFNMEGGEVVTILASLWKEEAQE